jgi:transposase-like protein
VRWYLAYNLSLRNLEEMMAERGISVDHATVHRWVKTPPRPASSSATVRAQSSHPLARFFSAVSALYTGDYRKLR